MTSQKSICWEIQRCPASHYFKCAPFKEGKARSCWELPEGCIHCDKDCETCSVYAKARGLGIVSGGNDNF